MTRVKRLLSTFIPTHYDLSLVLERTPRLFRGTVTITGTSVQPETLSVHAKDLTIETVLVDGSTASWRQLENDELQITSEAISVGEHIVVIGFSGAITDAMHGLYPSTFEQDGERKELLATQFESHHAREVFPNVDEPEAKATFDVTLTTEQSVTVLGNQPIKWQREEDERLVTSFQTTPRMSTYLLAFVVGELQRKTARTSSGVEVSVWATPAQSPESLDFPLDVAVRTIEFYDEYFGVPYPLPKSDHVALPDFSSGAMENWGLITYREIALLADPDTTSVSSRQYIATVISHELAHQWFGNLVTMRWWNNLWLNESFATLMEYVAVDALFPQWNMWLEFASNESILALRRDAIDGVQPVQVDVSHPDEISTLFDGAIVYAKGARLLRMLQQYVGETDFRSGLQQYFHTYAYQNTEGDDLWNAIAASSGKDITGLMNTWISQPGYPIVRVADNLDETVTLTQSQFFIGEHQPSQRLWPIPLGSTYEQMPELLETATVTIPRTHSSLLVFNTGATSHYIPHYDDGLTKRLLRSIKNGELSDIDRLSFLNNSILLARAGVIPSAELINRIQAYENETSEPVWALLSMTLVELRKFVDDDPDAKQALRSLSRRIAAKQYKRLGWEQRPDESEDDTKLRATILSMTLYGRDEEALKKAKTLYETTDIEQLDAELRSIILSSVVHEDTLGEVAKQLYQQYKTTQNAELSQDICLALTSTKNADTTTLLLAGLKDARSVRAQDVARWFAYLIRNRYSRTATWEWVRTEWEWIEQTFGGDKSYDYFPQYAAGGLVTRSELDEYIAFFEPKQSVAALARVISLGITEIAARVDLIDRDGPAVRQALLELS